jgi:hypothetical protein
MTMNREELATFIGAAESGQLSYALRQLAEEVERFQRGMTVARMFNGKDDETFKEELDAIDDDGFLADLAHFGSALADAARRKL